MPNDAPAPPRERRRVGGAWARGDRRALVVLVTLPIVYFVPFALAGLPVVPGDDLTQNYPLRVLAGSFLRSGDLPLWDPFIWSGTPLLAGWNAGALYPGTWLFAFLPGAVAWTVNLVLVGVVAAVGLFVLLRLLHCGALGATLGALCFTYTGFMSGQLNHIGLVDGTGYLAWTLVAIELLSRARSASAAVRPALLLALSLGLCILAGEPRAVSSAFVVGAVFLVMRLLSLKRRALVRCLAATLGGVALGVGLAAIQWLPGLTFVSRSQRTLNAFGAFGSGSLQWTTILHNLLVPFLLGGNGGLGLPQYVGSYNLPEVTVGVGLVPLVAACAFLPNLGSELRSGAASLRRRLVRGSSTESEIEDGASRRQLTPWYALGLVGLLLTLGTTTPLGRLLAKIPLYGGERLQNRNAVMFDLALAVLLGFFVDDLARAARAARATGSSTAVPRTLSAWFSQLLSLVPVAGCVALIGAAYFDPLALQARLGVAAPGRELFVHLSAYLLPTLVIALVLGWCLVARKRLAASSRLVIVALVACSDTAIFLTSASSGAVPSVALAGPSALSVQLQALAKGGRTALYNPLVIGDATTRSAFLGVGEPDLNILRGVLSVQGYGSIVGGEYQQATSTHSFESLDPGVLRDGLANTLDLTTLLTLPQYLGVTIPVGDDVHVAGGPPVTSTGAPAAGGVVAPVAPHASGPWTIPAGATRSWFLAAPVLAEEVTVVVDGLGGGRDGTLEVALADNSEAPALHQVPVVGGVARLALATGSRGERVVIGASGASAVRVGAVIVHTAEPSQVELLDGSLQGALNAPQWSFDKTLGPFSVFENHETTGLAWLQSPNSRAPSGGSPALGTVATTSNPTTGVQQMLVGARHRALLVRSVAYQPGWRAELAPLDGGASRSETAIHFGLLQAVPLPAGSYRVTWHYAPRGLVASGALSLASVVVGAALVLLTSRRWRRRAWLARRARRQVAAGALEREATALGV